MGYVEEAAKEMERKSRVKKKAKADCCSGNQEPDSFDKYIYLN